MRVKKYQAVDMSEALRMIKEELGPDAVILSTRQVKRGKGAFGLLGRPILEVTAAADLDGTLSPTAPRPRPASGPETQERRPAGDHGAVLEFQAELDSMREKIDFLGRRRETGAPEALYRDLKSLHDKVDRLLDQTEHSDGMRLTPGLRRIQAHLEATDLEPTLASRILAFLQEKADSGTIQPGMEGDALREVVQRTVRVSGALTASAETPSVVALVGPTGVGKTTTVAKLAARCALQAGRRVGLITVDTFRIAAVEQLKKYAEIIGVPTHVALDADGFRAAIAQLADRELILVDTAGQSPRDEERLAELLQLFPKGVPIEVHLVLALTTRSRDLEKILRNYAPVRVSRLLLTKLDETDCRGPLLGLPLVSRLPLSYLTTGQNVPDDIEEATPQAVANYLLKGLGAGS